MPKRRTILYIILVLLFLVLVIQPSRDPDLGWHLRYGQYFFANGHVLRDNSISFVWPDYKWVQASWGYDLIVYQLFRYFGFLGLSVTAGFCTLFTFFILTWPQKRLSIVQLLGLGIVFIALTGPMWGGGMRTPTISTIFMALSIVLSDRILHPTGRKTPVWVIWLFPVFFLVWANLHGGFALGLILLSAHWVVTGIVSKIQKVPIPYFWTYGFLLFTSWLTPLMNPWGIRIYEETFKHTSNTNLLGISEWAPLTDSPIETAFTVGISLFTIILMAWKSKLQAFPAIIIILLATYLGLSANRFVIVLGVILVNYLSQILPHIHIKILQNKFIQLVISIVLISLVFLDVTIFHAYFSYPSPYIAAYTWEDFCNYTLYCSEQITSIMLKDPPGGNGYHPYNYGGYISWRLPKVKTFIDGRMAAWEENGKTPPVLEGDWISMPHGEIAFIKYDHEYHFRWVIVPTSSDTAQYLKELVKTGIWDQKYEDEFYSYFVKVKY